MQVVDQVAAGTAKAIPQDNTQATKAPKLKKEDGLIDWSMVSVDSTSCRAHQHAAGARKKPPRVPGKEARPGSTAPTRDSDAPGAD